MNPKKELLCRLTALKQSFSRAAAPLPCQEVAGEEAAAASEGQKKQRVKSYMGCSRLEGLRFSVYRV